ncbi:MAG TPA: hypothetical protein VGK32_01515 [Vicinamibacterales bacterium]|jgi:hypothetical protein
MLGKQSMVWLVLFVVLVALAGGAGGVIVDRYVLHPAGRPWRMGMGVPMPGAGGGPGRMGGAGRGQMMPRPGWLHDRLNEELNLTPAQREKLRAILDERRGRLDAIRTEMQGRMRDEQQALRAEIRGLLDAKQQQRFDQLAPALHAMPGGGMRHPPE